MSDLQTVRTKLREAGKKRGELALIAAESGVSPRTIYNLTHSDKGANLATLDKLLAYFKKAERRAKQ